MKSVKGIQLYSYHYRASASRKALAILAGLLLLIANGCSTSGNAWSEISSRQIYKQSKNTPSYISFISSTEGWGISNTGTMINGISTPIYHYQKGKWYGIEMEDMIILHLVKALDENNVWAVGGEEKTNLHESAVALTFDGKAWTKCSIPLNCPLLALAVIDKNNGYAIARDGTLLSFNEKRFVVRTELPNGDLYNCDSRTIGRVWITAGDSIYEYSGNRLIKQTIQNPDRLPLVAISMVNERDGWAAGYDGLLLHYDGNTWSEAKSPTPDQLNSIDVHDGNSGFAVSANGGVYRYDGQSWSQSKEYPGIAFDSVSAVSEREAWASGKRFTRTGNTTSYESNSVIINVKF